MRTLELHRVAAPAGVFRDRTEHVHAPAQGERRRVEPALANLRRQLSGVPRAQFHDALVAGLASLLEVDFAFLARFGDESAPVLHSLAFKGPESSVAAAPSRQDIALPDGLLQAGGDGDGHIQERLRDWLLDSGWLPPIDSQDVIVHPLRGCDAGLIGILGIASRAPIRLDDRHVRTSLEAYGALAERVLEQDNAIARIRADRSQLEAMIDTAMDAIVIADEKHRILRFNDAAEKMFCRTAGETVGRPLSVLIPANVVGGHDRYVKDFGRQGVTLRRAGSLGEVRGLRADGTIFPAEIAISCVNSGHGQQYTAIVRDITERKGAVERLTLAEAKFRSLVEQSLVGIFIVQGQRFRYLNPHLVQLLGCQSAAEVIDRIPLAEMIVPAERARVTAQVRECLAGRRRQIREDMRMLRRDGAVIQVELHGQTFEFGGRPAIIGVVLDVTERSRTEQALLRGEQLFRSMFEAMSEAVAVHHFVEQDGRNCDYRIVDVNAAFERHTGIAPADARGRLASELYGTGAAPFLDRFLTLAPGGPPLSFEVYFEPLRRRFSMSAFCLDRQRFVTVFEDVTEQRRLELEDRNRAQELSRTGGLLTLGEMASTLAHELNQPLTAIANFSAGSLVRLEGENASLAGLKDVLEIICDEAERAGKILNGIRKFMEKRDFHPAPIDVNELVREVIGLTEVLGRDERVAMQLDLKVPVPRVMADRVLIQIVLVNLIRNGFEAMEHAGERPRELRIRTLEAGPSHVEVQVSDTGCGLPSDDADEVFRAFFTTKHGGLGLGLAIARSIVESHGGRIWATGNGADAGARFHFTLRTAGFDSR